VQQYLRFDLPEILSRMESWLQTRNTTLNDINTCAKYFIMKVKTQATRKNDHKTPVNNTHSPLQMTAITPTDSETKRKLIYVDSRPKTPRSSVASSIRDSPAQPEHNNIHDYSNMTESILALQYSLLYSLSGLKEELCDHMKRTYIQIQQISDEVHSIKKYISLSSSILTGQVADMCEDAETIDINVNSTETKTQKKVQSFLIYFRLK